MPNAAPLPALLALLLLLLLTNLLPCSDFTYHPYAAAQVLSYHVIPGAAVLSSQLEDRQNVTTALQDADPLVVRLRCNKVDFEGATNDARVQKADIRVGSNIVVHVVDDVLLPEL
jgi:uncharacterized surface protein with fasciclin (FAS1) repeats